ncbi:interferon-related developmental regulator 2 isoform 3-T3 [Alca torda]
MPRSRRAARRGPGSARAGSPASDEEAGSEVLSHCSSASEGASPAEEAAGSEAAAEQVQEEEVEDRLKEHVDNLLDKRTWSHACPAWRASSAPPVQARRAQHQPSMALCTAAHSSRGPCSSPSAPPPTSRVSWTSECGLGGVQGLVWGSRLRRGEPLEWYLTPLTALLPSCPSCWLKLPPLLSSSSVALRILTGETIALVFELAQDMEEDLCHQDTECLCAQLKVLATESNKYRAKTDRRKQRSIFRDILRFIESGEYQEETIRFGLECMYVDSWARQRTYQAFKEVLGSGICHHLQNNELLREIFGLGPPLVLDAATLKASKVSRFEKHLYNSAAFKARTKARSRVRDKRADVL